MTWTRPILSIIIPVFKEAAIINTALLHLDHAMSGFPVEIIVVDGDSQESTIHAILKNEDTCY